jgi:hypothetical protein
MGTKQRGPGDTGKYELRADGEALFREAIHAAAKNGPKHRAAKKPVRKRSVVKAKVKR